MMFCKTIIPLMALVFSSFFAGGQDTNYVYQDTAILREDSAKAAAEKLLEVQMQQDEAGTEYDDGEYTVDTSLVNNQLSIHPDSIASLRKSKGLGYAKDLDSLLLKRKQEEASKAAAANTAPSWLERFFLSNLTKYFFWLVAVTFVCFILYKLFFTQGFFQRSYTRTKVTVMDDHSGELSHTADYKQLIAAAVTAGNYRLAVRFYYLQTLQKLSAKGTIQFAADKTNYQYVRELAGKPYKNEFAALTLNYEYIWYGEFAIDQDIFNSIENKFKQFNTLIK